MNVTYSPPLMDQIRGHSAAAAVVARTPVVVFVLASNSFVMEVDQETRQATAEPQQFLCEGERRLIPLPRWQWVANPITLEVKAQSIA